MYDDFNNFFKIRDGKKILLKEKSDDSQQWIIISLIDS